jgi:hypothetical protein
MTMTQLVLGTACGFLIAQAALYGAGRLLVWLRGGELLARVPFVTAARGASFLNVLRRYAAPVGVSAALIAFGAWFIGDYVATRPAHNADVSLLDSAGVRAAPEGNPPAAVPVAAVPTAPAEPAEQDLRALDPYADAGFKVQRKARRGGAAPTLKDALVERSEARARADLLRELQQHAQRSQYDCEAVARAERYLKAGLDVWGFAIWQVKYFPSGAYRGATLEQCKDIKNLVVASSLDLQSTVAQQNHEEPER